MKYEKGTFVVVPNRDFLEGQDPYVQVVYYWLCSFADERGTCFPSRALLAKKANISLKSVDKSLKTLEEVGFIEKTKRYHDQSPTTNLYQLHILGGGSAPHALGSPPQALGVARHARTELNPSELNPLTSALQSAPPFEIIEDRRDPEKERKAPDAARKQYEAICQWAEGRRGYKFVARTSQYSALKRARESDINPTRLKDRWKRLEGDTWRDGFDWWDVFKSFNKKA